MSYGYGHHLVKYELVAVTNHYGNLYGGHCMPLFKYIFKFKS